MVVPRALIALVLATALLTGCDEQAPDPTPPPSAAPQSSSTQRPPPKRSPKTVVVPQVVGSMRGPAVRMLRDGGFAVDVVRRNACPAGVVVEQRPTGRVRRDSTVRLVVLDPATMSCAMSPAIDPARQLVSWGRGDGAAPRFADTVDLLLGNTVVQTLADPLDPDAWELCEGYAERSCLSPLTVGSDRRFAVRTAPPGASSCPDRREPPPVRLVERIFSSVTLVATDQNRACMDALALQVWVDDEDRIEAVNLLLGSP